MMAIQLAGFKVIHRLVAILNRKERKDAKLAQRRQ
jgi:hypothetical protein